MAISPVVNSIANEVHCLTEQNNVLCALAEQIISVGLPVSLIPQIRKTNQIFLKNFECSFLNEKTIKGDLSRIELSLVHLMLTNLMLTIPFGILTAMSYPFLEGLTNSKIELSPENFKSMILSQVLVIIYMKKLVHSIWEHTQVKKEYLYLRSQAYVNFLCLLENISGKRSLLSPEQLYLFIECSQNIRSILYHETYYGALFTIRLLEEFGISIENISAVELFVRLNASDGIKNANSISCQLMMVTKGGVISNVSIFMLFGVLLSILCENEFVSNHTCALFALSTSFLATMLLSLNINSFPKDFLRTTVNALRQIAF